MDISDIQNCADYFNAKFIKNFYIIVTYNENGFILIGERDNFPHLMGIPKNVYRSNGYRKPRKLFDDILQGKNINTNIIPNNIATTSKMYRKVDNFMHSADALLENKCPAIIKYDPSKNTYALSNVDILITDIEKGYMLGWVDNGAVNVNADINISKYCISTWIDESNGGNPSNGKTKYFPDQDVELVHHVLVFDQASLLVKRKEYRYRDNIKLQILNTCSSNNCNLLMDETNAKNYIKLARAHNIPCKINGIQI